jgi:hypothetical protein
MAVTTTQTNKPINPRGNDQSPKGYNRAALYSGKALDFDGVNDEVDLGTQSFITSSGFSISTYLNLDDDSEHYIFSTGYSNADSLLLYSAASSTNFGVSWYNGSSATLSTAVDYTIGEWFHALITYDGTTLKIYKNGVEAVSESFAIDNIASGVYEIGWASPRAKSTAYLQGKVGGFKIFNTALTAAQVADLYNNPEKVVPTGVDNTALKLWLPMMEGAGTTAYDGSGNGNHGTISGATWTHGIGAPVSQTAVIDWNKGTNLLAYSEEFSNAYWGKLNSLPSSEETGVTAPDGNGSVTTRFTFSALNHIIRQYIPNYGSYKTSAGVWVYIENKGTGGTELAMDWGDGTGKVFDVAGYDLNTWYKLEFEDITRGPFDFFDIGANASGTAPNGLQARFWGAHLNLGTTLGAYVLNNTNTSITSPVLLPQGLTSGRDITGVNLFENVRKQGALNLDGNSWAEVHDNASLDITDAISLECWINSTDKDQYHHIISKSTASSGAYAMVSEVTTGYLGFQSALGTFIKTDYNVMDGNWNHIVLVYDEVNAKFYINGTLDDTIAYTTAIGTNDVKVHIGARGNGIQLFEAAIAQPRIYNRALTAEEVERNYNAGKNIYK